jgi:aspartyl-tRNA(Asn)/glutamyl-tRNA(Gln) amidotransferase subunit A
VTGFRPTFGLVSRRGAMALSWSMDKIGPMARSVADCAAVCAAIVGHDPDDPSSLAAPAFAAPEGSRRYRLTILRGSAEAAQPEVRAAFEAALPVLGEFADVDEIALPDYPYGEIGEQVIVAEAASLFEDFIAAGRAHQLTAPEDRYGLADGLTMPAVDYLRAMRLRRRAAREVDQALAGFDAIIAPATRVVASPLSTDFRGYFDAFKGPSLGGVGNICGLPSISVPNGFGERGLPTGLELMGRAFADQTVLDIAAAYQARTDWHLRRPAP